MTNGEENKNKGKRSNSACYPGTLTDEDPFFWALSLDFAFFRSMFVSREWQSLSVSFDSIHAMLRAFLFMLLCLLFDPSYVQRSTVLFSWSSMYKSDERRRMELVRIGRESSPPKEQHK